jgi:hypothetical protein
MQGPSLLTRTQDNLQKALEAEKEAEIADAQAAKDVWLRIAKSYRDLAALISGRRGIL